MNKMSYDKSMREIAEDCDDCEIKQSDYDSTFDVAERAGHDVFEADYAARNAGKTIKPCAEHDAVARAKADTIVR